MDSNLRLPQSKHQETKTQIIFTLQKWCKFFRKAHLMCAQKLFKPLPKALFLLPHQWKLGGPIKLKGT